MGGTLPADDEEVDEDKEEDKDEDVDERSEDDVKELELAAEVAGVLWGMLICLVADKSFFIFVVVVPSQANSKNANKVAIHFEVFW